MFVKKVKGMGQVTHKWRGGGGGLGGRGQTLASECIG